MRVDLKNSVFVITGTLSLMTPEQAEATIKKVGGTVAKSVTQKTNYLIIGKKPGSKYAKARNMGIPILTEEDFKALISGETVEVEEVGAAGERSVDELLGEVRSVMQGVPTPAMWDALMTLIDTCRAEEVHVLTEYIDSYITRWTRGSTYNASQQRDDPRARWWYSYQRGVMGELRAAPERWIGEMQQHVDSPKYRLVRALDLRATKLSSAAIIRVMHHPSLEHLERLILPARMAPSKSLTAAICKHKGLTYLNLGKVDARSGLAFMKQGTTPRALRELDLSHLDVPDFMREDETFCEFLHAPYFHTVETLHLRGSLSHEKTIFEQAARHDLLPSVNHLTTMSSYDVIHFLCELLPLPWTQAHITRLSCRLAYETRYSKMWQALLHIDYGEGRLEVLDLSLLSVKRSVERSIKLLMETLPDSRLLGHVDRLVLGALRADKLVEALSVTHPHLEVV